MYRTIITPTEKEHTLELPKKFFGKKVEVLVNEIAESDITSLPSALKNKAFWEDIEFNPDFPSVEEIRKITWPKQKQ